MTISLFIRVTALILIFAIVPSHLRASDLWRAPFDSVSGSKEASLPMTLSQVLRLVASSNPTLAALELRERAFAGRLSQAGLWSNPEFALEFEEIGWDAPGFRDSEISFSISQELELFGQRGARKHLAGTEVNALRLQTNLSAFDLYLETKNRFYTLAHAQEAFELSENSKALADHIVDDITLRMSKGAALESELLLAQFEQQRAQLRLEVAGQEMQIAAMALSALWNSETGTASVYAEAEPDFDHVIANIATAGDRIDSTRTLLQLNADLDVLRAERSLASAEARPPITLTGGIKRLEASSSNSLLLGVALPLPLLNQNQGLRRELEARSLSMDFEIRRAKIETAADIRSRSTRLDQLIRRHSTLDSLLLPTANDAYNTIQKAYEAGRLPYTHLLEAERSLNELHFEHNDLLLEIHRQIVEFEGVTGQILRIDEER